MIKRYNQFIKENNNEGNRREILSDLTKNLDKSSKILDIGCNDGIDSLYLNKLGFDVYSLDCVNVNINPTGFKQLQNLIPDGRWIDSNIKDPMPFKDNFFDLIYARLSLHYFTTDELDSIFKELERILVDGGKLWLSVKIQQDSFNTGKKILSKEVYINIIEKYFKLIDVKEKNGILYNTPANWIEITASKS